MQWKTPSPSETKWCKHLVIYPALVQTTTLRLFIRRLIHFWLKEKSRNHITKDTLGANSFKSIFNIIKRNLVFLSIFSVKAISVRMHFLRSNFSPSIYRRQEKPKFFAYKMFWKLQTGRCFLKHPTSNVLHNSKKATRSSSTLSNSYYFWNLPRAPRIKADNQLQS